MAWRAKFDTQAGGFRDLQLTADNQLAAWVQYCEDFDRSLEDGLVDDPLHGSKVA